MTRRLEDLALISAKTLERYNVRAIDFREGTRDRDLKQNIEALPRVLSVRRKSAAIHIRGAA
ncbi:MAG: hypothetical protein WCA09_09950 [Burkholderiales bacterium]